MAYQQTAWKLDDLFSKLDSPEVKAALADLENQVAAFESQRAALQPDISPVRFLEIIRKLEAIEKLGRRLHGFAGLSFAGNTQDQAVMAFMGDIQQRLTGFENRTLFFSLWWKTLDDANVQRLLAGAGDYRYWLEEMRHFKPHTLSEAEEKIINTKNVTGANALNNLYNTLTNRYTFKLTVNGEEKELTRGELMVYVRQSDPAVRAAAYQELLRVYAQDGTVLSQIYQALVRDWFNEQVELRRFSSPISVRNLYNDIPDDVVDTLLDVCRKNAVVFQRFFQLKARWLGMERLRRYDIYAPVVQSDKTYPFERAAEVVFDAFEKFNPRVSELAQRVFADGHLDSEVRKGKQSGAFCASITPDLSPWVLLNYQGRADDVATMAHELGHAIHAMLASEHTLFTYHSSLPLAETASTFGEMLLIDRLLAEETDEQVRRDLLFRQVDDAYATIMRQAYFALFEREAHALVQDGATGEQLADAYLKLLKEQLGDAVDVSDEFRWEWAAIPHFFHTPFYVYAYSFGQLLVLALYEQYRQEGEAFKPRYLKILSAGGSDAPEKILSEAGIDIHSPVFWQGGFDVLRRLVEQLEAIPVG